MIPNASGVGTVLPAFANMYNAICSTAIHQVSVAGLLAKLTSSPPKKSPEDKVLPPVKKRRLHEDSSDRQESKPWNPLLKAALEGPMKLAKNPGLNQIKAFCGLSPGDPVIPNCGEKDCRHFFILNKCKFGKKCKFHHSTATDAQAKAIFPKLEKFINAPDGLQGKP